MTPIETSIQAALVRHPEIRLAILFGSLATGEERLDSDVDLAIDAGRLFDGASKMLLMAEIAECTGRPVDLVDLRAIGEPLLGQILKYGKRILGKDSVYAELIKRHLFDEADFMPCYRGILRERRNAWIGK